MSTTRPATSKAVLAAAERAARRGLRRVRERAAASAPAHTRRSAPRLTPATALRENGFTVFRGLFTPAEAAAYARRLKADAGIVDGQKFMRVDSVNSFETARDLVFEGRIVDAVRSALGDRPKFLQVGDLHYLHDTAGWHRDSVHRAQDASRAPDWRPDAPPYGVVKAILYMECDNAAMGLMAGSHASPIEMDRMRVKRLEQAGGHHVIGATDDPNLRLTDAQKQVPLAWKAQPGDVLVFDERLYHAGRRVENGAVTSDRSAPKFTLSMVFGLDNEHSERFYSYFRFVRTELRYRDFDEVVADELTRRGLVPTRGWTDYYLEDPDGLEHVHLQGGLTFEEVRARYR